MVIHKFSPLLSYLSTPFLCAAGIGRTFWHRKVIPAQTACRETYGLLLYAVRSLHPTIRGGRSHLPHGTNRTPRTSRRCDPEGTFRGECSKAGEAVSKTAWVGSIPNRPCHFSGCSSVSRARGLGPRGREGGTHHSDQYGPVIQ